MNTRLLNLVFLLWQIAFVSYILINKPLVDFQRHEFILIGSTGRPRILTCHVWLLVFLKNRIRQLYFLLRTFVGSLVPFHLYHVVVLQKIIEIIIMLFVLIIWLAVIFCCTYWCHRWAPHITELTNTLNLIILLSTYDWIIVVIFYQCVSS